MRALGGFYTPGDGGGGLTPAESAKLALMGYVIYDVIADTTDFDLPIPGGPTEGGDVEVIGYIVNEAANATYTLRPDGLTTDQTSFAIIGNSALATPADDAVSGAATLLLGDCTAAGGHAHLRWRLSAFIGRTHSFEARCLRKVLTSVWWNLGEWRATTDPTFHRVHASVGGTIQAGSWFAIRKIGMRGDEPPSDPLVAVDDTNKTEEIQLTGRAWVNAANDVWNGRSVTRYNESDSVWIGTAAHGFTPTTLSVEVVCTADLAVNGSRYFAVFVDGVFFAGQLCFESSAPIEYKISGLPAGPKVIQLVEGFAARFSPNAYDNGADGPISATYITGVRIPAGQPLPTRRTATKGTVMWGDSLLLGSPNQPWPAHGWAAQYRTAAWATGDHLVAMLGAGAMTLRGSGPNAAQIAAMAHDSWVRMGSTDKRFFYFARPNDYKYADLAGSIQTTPTQLTTRLGDILDALNISDAGFKAYVVVPFIPNDPATEGVNAIGVTKANYSTNMAANIATGRPYVTVIDGTSWGLAYPADYADQTHPDQSGSDIIVAAMLAAVPV